MPALLLEASLLMPFWTHSLGHTLTCTTSSSFLYLYKWCPTWRNSARHQHLLTGWASFTVALAVAPSPCPCLQLALCVKSHCWVCRLVWNGSSWPLHHPNQIERAREVKKVSACSGTFDCLRRLQPKCSKGSWCYVSIYTVKWLLKPFGKRLIPSNTTVRWLPCDLRSICLRVQAFFVEMSHSNKWSHLSSANTC